jgi:aldehyde dehydrogenase (NAD+)
MKSSQQTQCSNPPLALAKQSWMKNQKVSTPMALIGTSSWYKYEPKGVCLIISPWNFPVNLTFGPLVSAIAAGNTVIIKPSEMTPNIVSVMAKIIADLFNENEIALVEGTAETSSELLKLPFNHIFFTGSPAIGKIVMSAAAKHLTSVTLELGGKSPTIIDKTANLKTAAKLITWGKFLNNGQICVSPDYLLINEDIKDEFIKEMKIQIQEFYSSRPSESESYCRIVNEKHFNRLTNHIKDAKNKGTKIEFGGNFNNADNFIEPTIISQLPKDATILEDEIFGPILPILTFKNINETIDYINLKEKPLALYIYSQNKNNVSQIIKNTRAGSTCINTNVVQYSNNNLPFGGSNNSGIGKSHGKFGFEEFSNQRAILKQHRFINIDFHFPPYTKSKQKFVDFSIKWF